MAKIPVTRNLTFESAAEVVALVDTLRMITDEKIHLFDSHGRTLSHVKVEHVVQSDGTTLLGLTLSPEPVE